jgi:glycosyltransferase involved in cell wall biosynthesis
VTNILIHSNAPHVSTGYGVQCALLAERLKADGHNVAVSATYGQQGAIGKWNGITMYPTGYTVNSSDTIHHNAYLHFGFDELNGWIIPLLDIWALNDNPYLNDFNIAAWVPVDHFPVPPDVLKFFKKNDAVPVAMSKFGMQQLEQMGLDPVYVPLAVDTKRYKPTKFLDTPHPKTGELVRVNAREWLGIPDTAFVVGMVAMNKGWSRDRKGFNEALRAFGAFWRKHNDAVLYLHSYKTPLMDGFDLIELATHAGVPHHAIVWPDQFAYRLGFSAEQMAATYTAMDVLLAPSHGEGFCVPLIEAQACGVPVIASDFTAQTELVGAGWLVTGQLEWDPTQHASYLCPFVHDIVDKLEQSYAADLTEMAPQAVEFAQQYDADVVFDTYWRPFLDTLQPPPAITDREPMTDVAVIVPCLRPENEARLYESFNATNDGSAHLYIGEYAAPTRTYAENVNTAYKGTIESFVCIVGDDVEFTPGWLQEARTASVHGDVVGTHDSEPGRVRNPDVAAGKHADHFLIRRSYIEDRGSSLAGPGVVAREDYQHWYTDKEIIALARARGVYVHATECRIVHHHPGYDGDEDARRADPVYMKAVDAAEQDRATFLDSVPLIEMQRVGRGKVR